MSLHRFLRRTGQANVGNKLYMNPNRTAGKPIRMSLYSLTRGGGGGGGGGKRGGGGGGGGGRGAKEYREFLKKRPGQLCLGV